MRWGWGSCTGRDGKRRVEQGRAGDGGSGRGRGCDGTGAASARSPAVSSRWAGGRRLVFRSWSRSFYFLSNSNLTPGKKKVIKGEIAALSERVSPGPGRRAGGGQEPPTDSRAGSCCRPIPGYPHSGAEPGPGRASLPPAPGGVGAGRDGRPPAARPCPHRCAQWHRLSDGRGHRVGLPMRRHPRVVNGDPPAAGPAAICFRRQTNKNKN